MVGAACDTCHFSSELVPFRAPTLFLISQVLLLVYIVNLRPCLAVASLASPFSLTNSHLFTTPPRTHLHLRTLASPTCVLQPFTTINVLIYNEPKLINVENGQKPSKTINALRCLDSAGPSCNI